ncbi:MAG: thioredoxin family protein [Paludibacter sp. 47-17]|mgnify:CR=1 FL=1|jgi:small redox-active disulfide protein 2|nr:MAG: thioredoxin family protein [Paludibacter sp. 47-17]
MEIKVLGPGCPKCKTLYQNVETAVKELGIDASITKVDDIMEIMGYNIITTPALVIDGKVVAKGFVPNLTEIKSLLTLKR